MLEECPITIVMIHIFTLRRTIPKYNIVMLLVGMFFFLLFQKIKIKKNHEGTKTKMMITALTRKTTPGSNTC